jgi:transcriptional regulator with XRE-family HTH domain
MSIQKLIGQNVKNIRESKGWSQYKLSEESGLHYTYLSGIECGTRNPTVEIICKIAQTLNVKPEVFLIQNKCSLEETI